MNICFVCHGYPPAVRVGGIEIFTQSLARGLVGRGHNVTVIGYTKDITALVEEDDQGVHVLRLPPVKKRASPTAPLIRLRLESAIRQVVRQCEIDLVECPDVGGSLLIGSLGAPLVVRMHGAHLVHFPSTGRKPQRLALFFEKRTLRLANHLVAVSVYIRDATLSSIGLSNHPCPVIYNGVDTSIYKQEPGISRDKNRILFVGRLSETKGAPNLFRALPLVFHRFPNAYLYVVGKDPLETNGQKASLSLLEQMPAELRPRVKLVGELLHDQMPKEYQKAALAVFPSRAEAHPLSVVEAMACGTPTIFMSTGPGPEMIRHLGDGLLCDTNSPQAIADAIICLLRDPMHAEILGERAAKRIASDSSLEKAIDRNEMFYQMCIKPL